MDCHVKCLSLRADRPWRDCFPRLSPAKTAVGETNLGRVARWLVAALLMLVGAGTTEALEWSDEIRMTHAEA